MNLCALLAQALLASRLLRYGGIGAVLLLLPVISLVSYSTMALLPVLAVVRVMKIAENATNYSIDNTARQVIWLPTTAEMKYWTKPAIDSLVRAPRRRHGGAHRPGRRPPPRPLEPGLSLVNVALVAAGSSRRS